MDRGTLEALETHYVEGAVVTSYFSTLIIMIEGCIVTRYQDHCCSSQCDRLHSSHSSYPGMSTKSRHLSFCTYTPCGKVGHYKLRSVI